MPIGKQFPLYLMTNVGILSEDFDEEVEILRHHHPPPRHARCGETVAILKASSPELFDLRIRVDITIHF